MIEINNVLIKKTQIYVTLSFFVLFFVCNFFFESKQINVCGIFIVLLCHF